MSHAMMNSMNDACGFAVSVPGAGHIRYGTPCQDASGVAAAPRPAAIVCDGRGSAPKSHFGAQEAVKAFFRQVGVLEPFLAGILDRDAPEEKWTDLCRLFYRTLFQVKKDLAAERGGEERDYDFTVAFAIAGKASIGVFQVGDGAVVLRQNGVCRTAFPPDKGEFANQTHFLRQDGETTGKFHARLFPAEENTEIALTSDGPEYLMFRQADMVPGPVFDQMLADLAKGELCEQDVRDFLTRSVWATDARGADDRSLVVLLPRCENAKVSVSPKLLQEEKQETKTAEEPKAESSVDVPSDGNSPSDDPRPPMAVSAPTDKAQSCNALPWIAAVLCFLAGWLVATGAQRWKGHASSDTSETLEKAEEFVVEDILPTETEEDETTMGEEDGNVASENTEDDVVEESSDAASSRGSPVDE